MPIPRLQLFELEDQEWFPATPRDLATDYLSFVETKFALHRPVVPLLRELLRTSGSDAIVDLCSGGSGPLERVRQALVNAFHHFAPDDAVAVLRDAARAGQPIGVFEMIQERSAQSLVPMVVRTPLLVLFATPFIRPFQWRRLLWTYLLPAVPLTCWWDGVVSQLRAYTVPELERLASLVGVDGYVWRAGRARIGSTPGQLTYLLGWPER